MRMHFRKPFIYENASIPMSMLESTFNPGSNGSIEMPSRRTLVYKVSSKTYALHDAQHPEYAFMASVTEVSGKDAFNFHVDNINESGKNSRHPDIYPARLLARSVKYFEDVRDNEPIPRIRAAWYTQGELTNNYVQYERYRNEYGLDRVEEAAKNTWTGRQAAILGFTVVADIRQDMEGDQAGLLQVLFDRP